MARHREKPKSLGPVIGIVLCLGAIGGFLLLYMAGVFNPRNKDGDLKPPAQANGTTKTPIKKTENGGTTRTPTPAVPGQILVDFSGSFTREGDTRRVVYKCPHCKKEVLDVMIPKCPHLECAKSIKWPTKVPCGFCGGPQSGGVCKTCKGTGKCPICGNQPRMLYDVRRPCDACNTTGKCPDCEGTTKTCTFCEGGYYYPAKPKLPPKKTGGDDPPVPKPKEK